jgi:serine/threonine-protein kinase
MVVAATHEGIDQKVALKFLLPEVLDNSEVVERFMREGRASARVQSEHVARVLDVGALPAGEPYIVMEFLEGEDLERLLFERGALAPPVAVDYVLQACEALAEAHAHGIVHRDLKPANLFLAARPNGDPIIKVLDFGISKLPSSERDHVKTHTSALLGSPSYMSPEQLVSAGSVDLRSDLWAMGVVLYELLSGRHPFTASSMPELVALILDKKHEPISGLAPELQAAIDTCLQKDRTKRYANVAELARALAAFGPPHAGRSVERIEHVVGVPKTPDRPDIANDATIAARTSPPSAHARSSRFVIPALLAVVVAAVAVVSLRPSRARPLAAATVEPPAASSAAWRTPSAVPPPPEDRGPPTSAPPSSVVLAPASKPLARSKVRPSPPRASASVAASAAPCRITSYYDETGEKHFKQECP